MITNPSPVEHVKIRINDPNLSNFNYAFEGYRNAVRLKITGYIKKVYPDRVETELEGSTKSINEFLAWLEGEINIRGGKMQVIRLDYVLNFREFRIIK